MPDSPDLGSPLARHRVVCDREHGLSWPSPGDSIPAMPRRVKVSNVRPASFACSGWVRLSRQATRCAAEPFGLGLDEHYNRFGGEPRRTFMASAAACVCMTCRNVSPSGPSTINPTWFVFAASAKSRAVIPNGPRTSYRLGEPSRSSTSSTSWKQATLSLTPPLGGPSYAELRQRGPDEDHNASAPT
jgi:hypothetical protein